MKKILVFCLLLILVVTIPQLAIAALTSQQINSILTLLEVFGVDHVTISNIQKILFEGTGPLVINKAPVVTAFYGPSNLNVDQAGTWYFKAYDPENQPLTYTIDWGDLTGTELYSGQSGRLPANQLLSVSHAFNRAGSYRVTVVVTDTASQSSNTNMVVEVGNGSIRVISPNGGEVWKVNSKNKITWISPSRVSTVRIHIESKATHWVGGEAQTYVPDLSRDVVASAPNNGVYEWIIPPDTPGGEYNIWIQVYDPDRKNYFTDSSDNFFTINK